MGKRLLYSIMVLILLLAVKPVAAQSDTIRYLEKGSVHALSVPENTAYSFIWEITYGFMGATISAGSTSNVTKDIEWKDTTTYRVTVYPVLDSVDCPGEPKVLYVKVVSQLSLHAFDDTYNTPENTTVFGNVSVNDVDESGANLIYNLTPVRGPSHGKVIKIDPDGQFEYVPDPGFSGVDFFTYEVCNDNSPKMCDNAVVTIVVEPGSGYADVRVDKTGPYKTLYGGIIEYELWVKNLGPRDAKDLWVRDKMPFGVFNPQYSYDGQSYKPWIDSLYIAELIAGDSVLIRIMGDVSRYSPEWLYNQALVYTDNEDPNHLNNDSIWITHVLPIFVEPRHMVVPACSTAVIDISSESVNGIRSYEWHPGTFLSDSTIANPVFTPGISTNYVFTITDSLGNKATDTVFVVVPEPVKVVIPDTFYIDIGETDTLFATGSRGVKPIFTWTTNNGTILSGYSNDTLEIGSTGTYYLKIRDQYGCTDTDSVLVLLESWPPLAVNDTIAITAGTDSTFNILTNDSDRNKFTLRVTRILTQPTHHTVFDWADNGTVTFMPQADYWAWDSLEYEVCNNGFPEQCSSAWVYIHSLRPPLNADLTISKTGPKIDFWGDSLIYSLTVQNLGPDTAKVTVFDPLNEGLEFATFSIDGGISWKTWNGHYTFEQALLPEAGQSFSLLIQASINPTSTPDTLVNTAWVKIENGFIENNFENDTATWTTRIKIPVVANAGPDKALGSCQDGVYLDGTKSTGNKITYRWTPSTYLHDPTIATPYFRFPGKVTVATYFEYILTVTDDDLITDSDTMRVVVLPAPVANAGPDLYLTMGAFANPNGSGSTGALEKYSWTTQNGHIIPGWENQIKCYVDTFGVYLLTVTDSLGCSDKDSMNVYEFFYPPFAIPDYYSTEFNTPISGNVIDNDFDPNDPILEPLFAVDTTVTTAYGVKVKINSEGIFSYTPPPGYSQGIVDYFSYRVGNTATPPRYSRGYVKITVGKQLSPPVTDLHIKKYAFKPVVLISKEVEWELLIVNLGQEATPVTIDDSLSAYIVPPYTFAWHDVFMENLPNASFQVWKTPGQLMPSGSLAPGDSLFLRIRGYVASNSPDIIFNAAMVSSTMDDPRFSWENDLENRNVDTARVYVQSGVIAHLELVENFDFNRSDHTIGSCDRMSYLDGTKSEIENDFTDVTWSPAEYLDIDPNESLKAYIKEGISDTTINFSLAITVGTRTSMASVKVTISSEPYADAGPNRKINRGDELVIDGTNSHGLNAFYVWEDMNTPGHDALTNFDDGNKLRPVVNREGQYRLTVTDQHGCQDTMSVFITVNSLHPVNDMALVIEGYTFSGNVGINDFDPDLGDSIFWLGQVASGPFHGTLSTRPVQINGTDTLTVDRFIAHDGSYEYTPNPGFTGHDQFSYILSDNNNPDLHDTATVYIRVIDIDSINTPPVANPDALFVVRGDTIWSNLIVNDFDLDGNNINMETNPVDYPDQGKVSLTSNGDLEYVSNASSYDYDEFTYKICDDGKPSSCDTATVGIRIYNLTGVNHKPVAVDDAFFMVEKPMSGGVLENDYDPDKTDEITINTQPIWLPRYGKIYNNEKEMIEGRINYDGTFIYIPNEDFEGTDWFVYEICDDNRTSPECAYGTAYITALDESRYHTDMMVYKEGPAEVLSDDQISYTLTIKAKGPTFVNDVVLYDTISSLLSNAEYTYNGSPWTPWEGKLSWGRFMIGEEHSITIRADLPGDADTSIINTAWVWHDMVESDSTDNHSSVLTRIYQRVIADAGRDTVIGSCVKQLMLDGTQSVGMNYSTLQYSWKPAELLTNPTSATPIFNTTPGTHRFILTVSNTHRGFTRTSTDTVVVVVAPYPEANAGPDQWPTTETSVVLDGSLSTGAGPLEYVWWRITQQGNIDTVGYTATVSVSRTADYWLEVTDTLGCTAKDMVRVGFPIDEYDAVDDYVEVYQQQTDSIFVLVNDYMDEDDKVEKVIIETMPVHTNGVLPRFDYNTGAFIYTPEDYFCADKDSFQYTVTTEGGKSASAWVYIDVLCLEPIVPFGFSPNGDGINETLIIENIDLYPNNKLQVFNRWGNLVYLKERYTNMEPWDGVANKGLRIGHGVLPAAAYIYILELGELGERYPKQEILKGYIYIASDNRR